MILSKELVNIIKKTQEKQTKAYDTKAEVVRVEDGVAWVHIPGGVDETPVQLTINASPGDQVQVRVANGSAFLMGNGTAPPTDDKKANAANDLAGFARDLAESAAAGVKGIINYFWHDADGVHVSTAPGDATSAGVKNVLVDAEGMEIRSGSVPIAFFHSDEIRLGPAAGNVDITPSSLVFRPKYGASNFRYRGVAGANVTQKFIGDGVTRAFDIFRYETGTLTVTINGTQTTAFSVTIPRDDSLGRLTFTTAPAAGDAVVIQYTTTSWENPEFSFGINSQGGPYAVAEGRDNTASGIMSHAEGKGTQASGPYSHSQNHGTIAAGEAQTALGKYNTQDDSDAYALIVGNGKSDARANAAAISWTGDLRVKGDIYTGCADDSSGGVIVPKTVVKQISANSTATINSKNARYTLTLIGGASTYRGMYLIAGYGSSVETKAISSVASGVVTTSGTNVIINNNEAYAMVVVATVYAGSVTIS